MNLVIDRLKEAELDQLFEFRKRVFPANDRQLDCDRWKWLYLKNPASQGRIPVWVIKADDMIVGSISSTDTMIKMDNRTVLASFGNDYYVEKKYLGLPSLRLLKAMLSEYEINIAANLSESARKLFEKMKYTDLSNSLDIMTLPLLSTNRLKSHLKHLVLSIVRRGMFPGGYDCAVSDSVPESIDNLWEKVTFGRRVTIIKNRRYLEWRYGMCPSAEFKYVSAAKNDKLQGVAVITTLKHQGAIMDLIVPEGENNLLASLLHDCLKHFRSQGCTECYTHISKGWITNCFKLFGFYEGVSDVGFMIHTAGNDGTVEILNDPKSWHFMLGDTDRI